MSRSEIRCAESPSDRREPEAALAAHESCVLAAVNRVVAENLARFKDFIEARAEEAG